MKKKILSFLTTLTVLTNLFIAAPTAHATNSELAAPGTNASILDGKKILFIGCSYTYYGGTVVANGGTDLESRQHDRGFFHHLCKANGAEVDVTDWCFGGHSLKQIMGGNVCQSKEDHTKNNINHLEILTDRKYDYVVIQDISYTSAEKKLDKTDVEGKINLYVDIVKDIMDIFTAENPDVKFYYGLYTGIYTSAGNSSDALRMSLERIKDLGVTILDWGTLTYDIANGVTQVPNSTLNYNLSSFKVDKDDKHQNLLSGYLYALMLYCAITGETAVGQPYDFCYDENNVAYPVGTKLRTEDYIARYYDGETNFPQVFASKADMEGLQELTNEYIKEDKMPWKKYLYTVTLNENGGTDIDDLTIWVGHTVYNKIPDTLREGYTFDGWYKDEALTSPLLEDDKVNSDMILYAKWVEGEAPDTGEIDNSADEWDNPFVDVKESDWYYDNVKFANENGLMNGTTDTTFTPDGNVTRAMLVTVLYRNEGEPATNRSIPFADVDMSAYYANAVSWAQQNGIINGVSETQFAPDSNITREQLASILYRYAIHKGMDAVTLSENLGFEDADEISEYAISSLNWATGCGLINGYEDNTLRPQSNTTRAEAATILQRFVEANN